MNISNIEKTLRQYKLSKLIDVPYHPSFDSIGEIYFKFTNNVKYITLEEPSHQNTNTYHCYWTETEDCSIIPLFVYRDSFIWICSDNTNNLQNPNHTKNDSYYEKLYILNTYFLIIKDLYQLDIIRINNNFKKDVFMFDRKNIIKQFNI